MTTLNALVLPLTVLAAVGAGLIAGLLFAFSTSVMKALAMLPPEQGMAAMRNINVVILNPLFLAIFTGTALLCLGLALWALFRLQSPAALWLLVGAVAYVVGCFGVTMVFNVPLNNQLARAELSTASAAVQWPAYVEPWVRWNHFRTAMGAVGSLALVWGAVQLGRTVH